MKTKPKLKTKCYYASYNVGNVEVWSSELYWNKDSVFTEIKNSLDDIAEAISNFSLLEEFEAIEYSKRTFVDLKKFGMYKDKENQLDFFILERPIQ